MTIRGFLLFAFFLGSHLLAFGKKKTYEVHPALSRISLNGIPNEWVNFEAISFDCPGQNADPNKAAVKVLWDYEKLYVLFQIADKKISAIRTEDNSSVWEDDCIEIYLSTSPAKAPRWHLSPREFQFVINPLGTSATIKGSESPVPLSSNNRDFQWFTDVIRHVTITGTVQNNDDLDDGYIVECAIFWSSLNYFPHSGDTLLADFCFNDIDGNDVEPTFCDWSNMDGFGEPKLWNVIILTGTPTLNYASNAKFILQKLNENSDEVKDDPQPSWNWITIGGTGLAILTLLVYKLIAVGRSNSHKEAKKEHDAAEVQENNNTSPVPEDLSRGEELKEELEESVAYETSSYSREIVDKVMQLIDAAYNTDIRTSTAASKLNMSERHLQRILKQVKGKTFREMLNEKRMEQSHLLLKESNMQIIQIAFEVGFNSFEHFRRVFTSYFGQAPSEYRKSKEKYMKNDKSRHLS